MTFLPQAPRGRKLVLQVAMLVVIAVGWTLPAIVHMSKRAALLVVVLTLIVALVLLMLAFLAGEANSEDS